MSGLSTLAELAWTIQEHVRTTVGMNFFRGQIRACWERRQAGNPPYFSLPETGDTDFFAENDDRVLTLEEKFVFAGALHDAECVGVEKINPWPWPKGKSAQELPKELVKGGIFWAARVDEAKGWLATPPAQQERRRRLLTVIVQAVGEAVERALAQVEAPGNRGNTGLDGAGGDGGRTARKGSQVIPTLPGWLALLSDFEQRFESLSEFQATLLFYVAPTRAPFLTDLPRINSEPWSQIVQEGMASCEAVSPAFRWWCLFANPQAPNQAFLTHVVFPKRDRFIKLAEEAWQILPAHVRELARGAKGQLGWMFVVYRMLKEAGLGTVNQTPALAWIDMDIGRASALAVRELVRQGSSAQDATGSPASVTVADGTSDFDISPFNALTLEDYGFQWEGRPPLPSPPASYSFADLEGDLHKFAFQQKSWLAHAEKEGEFAGKQSRMSAAGSATDARELLGQIPGVQELQKFCNQTWREDLSPRSCRRISRSLCFVAPELSVETVRGMQLSEVARLIQMYASRLKDTERVSETVSHDTIEEVLQLANQLKSDALNISTGGSGAKETEREARLRLRTMERLCGKLKLTPLPESMKDCEYDFQHALTDVEEDCKRMVEEAVHNKPPESPNWGDQEQAQKHTEATLRATQVLQTNQFRLNDSWNRLWRFGEEVQRIPKSGPSITPGVNANQGGSTQQSRPSKPVQPRVFFSYSHKDKKWLERIQMVLKPAVQADLLWADTKVNAGEKWKEEIQRSLLSATAAVLLVSPHFLASDFIAKNELPPLLEAAEKKGLTILWVHVSHSMYKETPIAAYEATHDPARPLDSLKKSKRDQLIVTICEQIKLAAEKST